MTASRSSIALVASILTAFLGVKTIDAQVPGQATRPTMTAKLVDPDKKAAPGQGHLHYQVDNGSVVATPSAKLSFHELTPGSYTIRVMLAGNDHKPLGPQQQLTVTVPKGMTSTSGTPSDTASKPTGTSSKPADTAPAAPKKSY